MASSSQVTCAALLLACMVCLLAPSPAAALNIHQPIIQGRFLDYCPTLSSKPDECGLSAADAWCQYLGYDRATSFTGPTPAPAGNKTLTVKSRETCASNCSTFVAINCVREQLLVNPSVNGTLLDWCLDDGNPASCGWPAATAFCVKQGFSHGAWSFGGPYNTSINQNTYQLKSGKTCNARTSICRAFSSIFCQR